MTVTTTGVEAARPLHVGAERAPFVMLPRWLLHHRDISDGAKVLYGMLHDLVAGREGPTRPVTRGQLAGCCGVSIATVDRRLAELVDAGAVDKQAQFESHQGQLANVYWVRLSPPGAHLQPPVDNHREGGCRSEDPPVAAVLPGGRQPWGSGGRSGAAPYEEQTQEQELPPQPPRPAGGQAIDPGWVGRSASRRSRALGTNPRAEADRAEQARLETEAEARRAELEQAAAERRAAERAAEVEADRLSAEALAVSGCLDDSTLADVIVAVRESLSGPLAASPMAVARAVVGWCRTAANLHGGELVDAVAAGLHDGLTVGEGTAAPLALPAAPPGTASLRARIATLLNPLEEG